MIEVTLRLITISIVIAFFGLLVIWGVNEWINPKE